MCICLSQYVGGSPIFIETAAIPTAVSETGGGVNVVTGQLGSVTLLPHPTMLYHT